MNNKQQKPEKDIIYLILVSMIKIIKPITKFSIGIQILLILAKLINLTNLSWIQIFAPIIIAFILLSSIISFLSYNFLLVFILPREKEQKEDII